jgi:hypothetical protein
VYRVEITKGTEWCSLYDTISGKRGTIIDSLNSPDGWSSFYLECIGEEPSSPQQGSLTVSSYGNIVPSVTSDIIITPYKRTLLTTPGRKDIIYGDTTSLTLTMIDASGNPTGEELLDAQYSIIRGNAYSTLQSLDSTVVGDTIEGVFPSAILRAMDDVNAPDSITVLIETIVTAPCPECGSGLLKIASKDSSKDKGRDIASIRKELLSQKLKRISPAMQMKSNGNPPHMAGSLKTLDNILPLSNTTRSSPKHLNKIQYSGSIKYYDGLTQVTVRKPIIKLTTQHTILEPLGDRDNEDNPSYNKNGPDKRKKIIDFSKVDTMNVTVSVKMPNGYPVPDYPFTLSAYVRPNSGGHDHNDNRPTGKFRHSTDKVKTFSDKTGSDGTAKYTYLCSGIGGVDSLYVKGKTDKDTSTAIILLKMRNFVELTEGDHYVLIGANAGGSLHSMNHFGETTLINVLKELADTAYSEQSYKLRFNDMSLIYGGPFDITNNWNTPHQNHREGVSIDVSSTAVTDDGSNGSITEKQLYEWFSELTQVFTYSIENEVQSARHYHVTVR